MSKNNRAQISDTITWVVATIIILVIIFVFVYASSLLAIKIKIVDFKQDALALSNQVGLGKWLFGKTEFAYRLNSLNKQVIDNFLIQQNDRP